MRSTENTIREAAVAGQFYSSDRERLSSETTAMLSDCDCTGISDTGTVRALISPHAGYSYSGETAAKGFSLLKNCEYRRIVILAPSHRMPFECIAASEYSVYRTPLGDVKVDSEAVALLLNTKNNIIKEITAAHRDEHSLEVQLPFLQQILPDVPIVPLICGQIDADSAEKAAEALQHLWERDTLWVISSDFTHYGYSFGYLPFTDNLRENIRELDIGAVKQILNLDYNGFSTYIAQTGATVCGAAPIKVLLKTIESAKCADSLGSKLIEYTNSGEISGDFSHCVGYASIAFFENNS